MQVIFLPSYAFKKWWRRVHSVPVVNDTRLSVWCADLLPNFWAWLNLITHCHLCTLFKLGFQTGPQIQIWVQFHDSQKISFLIQGSRIHRIFCFLSYGLSHVEQFPATCQPTQTLITAGRTIMWPLMQKSLYRQGHSFTTVMLLLSAPAMGWHELNRATREDSV